MRGFPLCRQSFPGVDGDGASVVGTVSLWVNERGQVVKLEMNVDFEVPLEAGKTVKVAIRGIRTISQIGEARIEIPKEALDKLSDPLD
jgi:hypothetical protein